MQEWFTSKVFVGLDIATNYINWPINHLNKSQRFFSIFLTQYLTSHQVDAINGFRSTLLQRSTQTHKLFDFINIELDIKIKGFCSIFNVLKFITFLIFRLRFLIFNPRLVIALLPELSPPSWSYYKQLGWWQWCFGFLEIVVAMT